MDIKKFFTKNNIKKVLDDDKTGFGNFYFDLFLIGLILVSSFIFVLETYFTTGVFSYTLTVLDYLIMIIFTVELIARNYLAKDKKKAFFSIYNLIDVFAIIPFWFISGVSLQFLRVFRILKLFRFFSKYFDKKYLSKSKANKITLLKMLSVLFILLFVSSSLIYTFEADSNDQINNFSDAVYLSLVTVTTVGFGDIVPTTDSGRFVTMIVILFGIFLIPVYIGSLLKSYIHTAKKRDVTCKKCGLKKHDYNATHCKMCGEIIYQEFEG